MTSNENIWATVNTVAVTVTGDANKISVNDVTNINHQPKQGGNVVEKSALLIIGLLCLLISGGASAADKIGFVDIRSIMMNSESGKKAATEFKNIFEKKRLTIQGKESELKKMKEALDKQRSTLIGAALSEKETLFQTKLSEYQALVKGANDDLQGKDQEMSKRMIPEIQKVVNAIGDKDEYNAIFDLSSIPIPYYNRTADLTKRVMDEFNKSYKPHRVKK